MTRPYRLTGPHKTKQAAIDDWIDGAVMAGRNVRRATVRTFSGWYAFDRYPFEDNDEARARLDRYLRGAQ